MLSLFIWTCSASCRNLKGRTVPDSDSPKPDPVVARLSGHQRLQPEVSAEAQVNPVANSDLKAADFPGRGVTFDVLRSFAYTFDGYAAYGMEACAKLANDALSAYYHDETLPEDINELRACLFFEARRWSLYEQLPDTRANIYMFALIDAIKQRLDF